MVKDFKEKEMTIGLGKIFEKPVTKRASSALKFIKDDVKKQTKAKDIKISNKVNEAIWEKGKFKGIRKISVKVVKDKEIARVYLKDEKIEVKKENKKEEKKDVKSPAREESKKETKEAEKKQEKTSDKETKK